MNYSNLSRRSSALNIGYVFNIAMAITFVYSLITITF